MNGSLERYGGASGCSPDAERPARFDSLAIHQFDEGNVMEPAQQDFDWTRRHVRNGDPATSIHAAESVVDTVHNQCSAILGELSVSDKPLAVEQVADKLGMTTHAVGKRMSDLERQGVIRRTDEIHRNRSGRAAFKWEAC